MSSSRWVTRGSRLAEGVSILRSRPRVALTQGIALVVALLVGSSFAIPDAGAAVVNKPTFVDSEDVLNSVACPATNFCVAVGWYIDSRLTGKHALGDRALIESWNGTAWSIVPNPGITSQTVLDSVARTSATDCTAVGAYPSSVDETTEPLVPLCQPCVRQFPSSFH